ncbi:MAG: hypothetical protein GC182_09095 [Rhodopseudomonas sp.]|nr:hypothetical protein [Rhodopseudomonas sp.]
MHEQIIAFLSAQPQGATDEAMQDGLGMAQNTQRPRRRELEQQGIVEASGQTALTRAGRKAVLWRLKDRKAAP